MKSAIMIAATGSGCGKTTITCALLAALKKKGLSSRAFKCGPDYIDPMFHKKVIGIPSKNLDLFLADTRLVRDSFYADNNSDISIVEGVMGLYDGTDSSSNEGSSYDLACRLDIPVILVVNAHGMGRSILAVIMGFQAMDEEKRIKGIILNNISEHYYETIKALIEQELNVRVLGYFPRQKEGTFESRYLGLKLPNEIEHIRELINNAAEQIANTVNLDGLLEVGTVNEHQYSDIYDKACNGQQFADMAANVCDIKQQSDIAVNIIDEQLAGGDVTTQKAYISKKRIAVAMDDAFCFFYEDNLILLRRLGVEIVEFSPIKDKRLPEDICGLILCGGYPELYARELSENHSMRKEIADAIRKGIPSLAECGGFMYLHDSITVEGAEYPMAGVVHGSCEKMDRLVRFGYLTIEEKESSFFSAENRKLRGHEFHYYDSSNNGADAVAVKPNGSRKWEAAHIAHNHWWGFAHLYYPSNVRFAESFVNKCEEWMNKQTAEIISFNYRRLV